MSVEAGQTQPFAHTGKLGNMFGLTFKNAILSILTLTLYRFWGRTSIRRRVWSRTWVMGDPLEYTGRGLDLFRGFLISLPTFFLPAIFVFYIAPFAMEPVYAAWLTLAFYLFAIPMVAAGRWWMRRYQLSRTRWRGIRMGLAGSARKFALSSWGWTILQTLSLGWYTPVARMNRARLLWESTRFGTAKFEFLTFPNEEPQQGLWWPFALGWIGTGVIAFASVIALGVASFALRVQDGDASPAMMFAAMLAVAAAAITLYQFVWAPYNAAAMNRIAEQLSLDGARFQLRAKSLSLFYISFFGLVISFLSLGLFAPLAGLLQVRYVFNRLEMIGAPRFAEIGQSLVEESESGESLGDAFDLDLGVGMI